MPCERIFACRLYLCWMHLLVTYRKVQGNDAVAAKGRLGGIGIVARCRVCGTVPGECVAGDCCCVALGIVSNGQVQHKGAVASAGRLDKIGVGAAFRIGGFTPNVVVACCHLFLGTEAAADVEVQNQKAVAACDALFQMLVNPRFCVGCVVPFVFITSRYVEKSRVNRVDGQMQHYCAVAGFRQLHNVGISAAFRIGGSMPIIAVACRGILFRERSPDFYHFCKKQRIHVPVRIMKHVGHSVKAVGAIGVCGLFPLRRCAIAKIPRHIIIIPVGHRIEFYLFVGAEIMVLWDFRIVPTIYRHGIGEVCAKTMCLKENA